MNCKRPSNQGNRDLQWGCLIILTSFIFLFSFLAWFQPLSPEPTTRGHDQSSFAAMREWSTDCSLPIYLASCYSPISRQRVTNCPAHFHLCLVSELQDDASSVLASQGSWKPSLTLAVELLLASGDRRTQTMVDVSSNICYFSLIALHYGYRTVSFEPVLAHREALVQSVRTNARFEPLHSLRPYTVSDPENYGGLDVTTASKITMLDRELLGQPVRLMNIDVERSFGPRVIAGARQVIQSGCVDAIFMKVTRALVESPSGFAAQRMLDAIQFLLLSGYHMYDLGSSEFGPIPVTAETHRFMQEAKSKNHKMLGSSHESQDCNSVMVLLGVPRIAPLLDQFFPSVQEETYVAFCRRGPPPLLPLAVFPQSSPPRLPRLIFSINTSRSGSGYLRALFQALAGVVATHEDPPDMHLHMEDAQARGLAATYQARMEKVRAIESRLEQMMTNGDQVYVDTSHLFHKVFWDVVMDRFGSTHHISVVIIRRDMALIMASLQHRGLFEDEMFVKEGRQWVHSVDSKLSLTTPLRPFHASTPDERIIAYMIDVEAHAVRFRRAFPHVQVVETDLENLQSVPEIRYLVESQLGLSSSMITPATIEVWQKIAQQHINGDNPDDFPFKSGSRCQNVHAIQSYLRACEHANLSVPFLPHLKPCLEH